MKGGRRPFGLTIILGGIQEEKPVVFTCDPAGVFFQWQAVAAGKGEKELSNILEENYRYDMDEKSAIRLVMKAFENSFDNPSHSLIKVIYKNGKTREVSEDELEVFLKDLLKEKSKNTLE